MPRKNTKTTQSEKKYSAIPPKTTATAVATPIKPVTAAAPVVTPAASATTAVATAPSLAAVVVPVTKPATPVVAAKTAVLNVEPMIASLNDLDADVAREAATSLGLAGDVKAVEPLIEVLSNSNGYFHSVVRCAAATSLAQLKDRRAVEPLLRAVHDPLAEPSCEAIRALVTLADPRAVAALVEVVRNRDGFFANSVRRTAVLGLAKLGGETAVAELRRVSADGFEDAVIREEATVAIPAK